MSEVLLYAFSHLVETVPGAVSEEAVEVLCAQWERRRGASILCSKECRFCSVIRFLSKWSWDQGPLLLEINRRTKLYFVFSQPRV